MRIATRLISAASKGDDRIEVVERGDAVALLLADGASGMPGGAETAERVVAGIAGAFRSSPTWDAHLAAMAIATVDAETLPGESTAVVVIVSPAIVCGASVGDSRAWLDADELTRGQRRKPRLGTGEAFPVVFERKTSGTIVVASDGLSASSEEVTAVIASRSFEALPEALIALASPLHDDLSLIVASA